MLSLPPFDMLKMRSHTLRGVLSASYLVMCQHNSFLVFFERAAGDNSGQVFVRKIKIIPFLKHSSKLK